METGLWPAFLGERMKKVLIFISCLGILSYVFFDFYLKTKIPENFEIPAFLLILGLIYFPFLIMFIIDKKNGNTEKYDPKDISDYHFLIGGISYVILLFLFLIVFIAKKIIK